MKHPIPAILLAAGGSARMGKPKQLLPYRGGTLISHVVQTILASVCRPVVIVIGAEGDAVRAALAGVNVALVENPRWEEGIGTSIAAGIAHLLSHSAPGVPSDGATGALLALCDQPMVTADVLNTLVRLFETGDHLAVACAYGRSLGVPAVFARELFGELLCLEASHGAKAVLQRHAERVAAVAFEPAAVDVDTPRQYAQLKQS